MNSSECTTRELVAAADAAAPSRWTLAMRMALAMAAAVIPGVQKVLDGIKAWQAAKTKIAKVAAIKLLSLAGLELTEFASDRDLLDDAKVAAAYDQFVNAGVVFLDALATAKAAKVQPPVPPKE